MKFTKIEEESGLSFLYKLIDNNQDKTFELTYSPDEVLEVVFDMAFEDDSSSTDATDLEDNQFHTISFTITKIIKDKEKKHQKGHVILVNPFSMPISYKLK